MTNLTAIVHATKRSALALQRVQRLSIILRHSKGADYRAMRRAYDRAVRDYERAQAVLRANPLPGDR